MLGTVAINDNLGAIIDAVDCFAGYRPMTVYIALLAIAALVAALLISVILRGGGDRDRTVQGGTLSVDNRTSGEESNASSKRQNWIIGESEGVDGKYFHVGERTITIGRKPTNFIQVEKSDASRVHCQIDGQTTGTTITDLDSEHGTYLNGEELEPHENYRLQDGDHFRLGSVEFEFQLTGDFDVDHGITARKSVGEEYERTTKKRDPGSAWREDIEEALERADGDLKEAAEQLGVEVPVLTQLMDQADLDT